MALRARTLTAALLVSGVISCGGDDPQGTGGASTTSTTSTAMTTSTGGQGGMANDERVLVPGTGFMGPTADPPAVGSGPGADKTVIAHWDAVPYVTFDGKTHIGVLAYHVSDVDRVELSLAGGPWLSVATATPHPDTGVVEYWATVDAATVPDGPIEVRAIAYPKVGIPAVLQGTVSKPRSSLFLNANAHGSLAHEVRHVATSGSDAADCKTPATACATLPRAFESASQGGSLDGAEIRLGAGTWTLPETNSAFTTANQWLTITSAPDVAADQVIVDGVAGPSDGIGVHVKHLHLSRLTLTGPINKAAPMSFEDYLWFDHGEVHSVNPNAVAEADCFEIGNTTIFSGVYVTDVTMDNMCNGPTNVTLARDVVAKKTAAGHSSGTSTVVNYTVEWVYGSVYMPGWPDYHGDVYQMYQLSNDIIIYGAKTAPGGFISSRGIVGSDSPVTDVAMDAVDLDIDGWVFSYCASLDKVQGPIDHMVIKNSHFVGSSNWCGESVGPAQIDPAGIRNVLIDHSVFENGSAQKVPQPSDLPGIRYVPAL